MNDLIDTAVKYDELRAKLEELVEKYRISNILPRPARKEILRDLKEILGKQAR